jgi:hypothetical protein
MKVKASLPPLWEDPEVEAVLREAEEELKRLSPKKRKELFGTDWLPPSPEDLSLPDWDGCDEVLPMLF